MRKSFTGEPVGRVHVGESLPLPAATLVKVLGPSAYTAEEIAARLRRKPGTIRPWMRPQAISPISWRDDRRYSSGPGFGAEAARRKSLVLRLRASLGTGGPLVSTPRLVVGPARATPWTRGRTPAGPMPPATKI